MANRLDLLEAPDWFLQCGDRIVEVLAVELAAEKTFARIFGASIFAYKRMDIGVREMPALRIYNDVGRSESQTGYESGDIKLDVIFPADIRRQNMQKFPDLVTSALKAAFRAQPFFRRVRAQVPGLNQLGWSVSYDKSLGFKPGDDVDPCPVTQLTVNFRVLLEEWDRYLESDDRSPETPFDRTLGDLERIYVETLAKDNDGTTKVSDLSQAEPQED